MTRPRNVGASVRARLTDRARANKENVQLVLTRYAIERLLYRLSRSEERERFVLKGAMLFSLWAEVPYRATGDLDLLGFGTNDAAALAETFRTICSMEVEEDGVDFLVDTIRTEQVREDDEYQWSILYRIKEAAMTTQVLKFVEFTDQDRKKVHTLPAVAQGDVVEMRVVHSSGRLETTPVPPEAAALIGTLLEHLARGERVAVLTEDQEVSPNDAANILGMSRPLVVHRMNVGDLPFRYIGKHRRAKLKDVLALKRRVDDQQAALDALAEDTEELMRNGL